MIIFIKLNNTMPKATHENDTISETIVRQLSTSHVIDRLVTLIP